MQFDSLTQVNMSLLGTWPVLVSHTQHPSLRSIQPSHLASFWIYAVFVSVINQSINQSMC